MQLHPYLTSLLGGALIGGSSAWLFFGANRIAGISGIVGGLVDGAGDRAFRIAFLTGLVLTGIVLAVTVPSSFVPSDAPLGRVILGGLLVGFGTRLGNGCTSGHGVCGISRLSPRSFVATATFVGIGMLTVAVVSALAGGRG